MGTTEWALLAIYWAVGTILLCRACIKASGELTFLDLFLFTVFLWCAWPFILGDGIVLMRKK